MHSYYLSYLYRKQSHLAHIFLQSHPFWEILKRQVSRGCVGTLRRRVNKPLESAAWSTVNTNIHIGLAHGLLSNCCLLVLTEASQNFGLLVRSRHYSSGYQVFALNFLEAALLSAYASSSERLFEYLRRAVRSLRVTNRRSRGITPANVLFLGLIFSIKTQKRKISHFITDMKKLCLICIVLMKIYNLKLILNRKRPSGTTQTRKPGD